MAILDAMINSLVHGSSVQKEVRGFFSAHNGELNEVLGSRIAAVCKAFKTEAESELDCAASAQDIKEFRKRTNNIINDVSRICREMIGYSIVNTKRTKGVYEYEAVEWIKAAKEEPDLATYTHIPDPVGCVRSHFDPAIHCVKPDVNDVSTFIRFFGDEGSPARSAFLWTGWTPEQFVSKMDAAAVDLEAVAKLLLDRLRGRKVA